MTQRTNVHTRVEYHVWRADKGELIVRAALRLTDNPNDVGTFTPWAWCVELTTGTDLRDALNELCKRLQCCVRGYNIRMIQTGCRPAGDYNATLYDVGYGQDPHAYIVPHSEEAYRVCQDELTDAYGGWRCHILPPRLSQWPAEIATEWLSDDYNEPPRESPTPPPSDDDEDEYDEGDW